MLRAAPAFRTPLILLAAVHHLLLTGTDDALGAYYATVSGDVARPLDDELYPTFARFVDAHRAEIEELVASRTTQTNEARRSIVTLPTLGLVASESGRPLALLEVGSSAGLNLLIDRFGFRIGSVEAGDPESPVPLELDLVEAPPDGYGPSMLALCRFDPDSSADCRLLAECHAHGRWIRWLDRDTAVAVGAPA